MNLIKEKLSISDSIFDKNKIEKIYKENISKNKINYLVLKYY